MTNYCPKCSNEMVACTCMDCKDCGESLCETELLLQLGETILQACKNKWGGTARCITSDGRCVNMADELNKLEREKNEP